MIRLINDGEDKIAYITLSLKLASRYIYQVADVEDIKSKIKMFMDRPQKYRQVTCCHHNSLKVDLPEVIGTIIDIDFDMEMVFIELNDFGVEFISSLPIEIESENNKFYVGPRIIGTVADKVLKLEEVICFDLVCRS